MSRRGIPGNIFLGENSEKVIENKKVDLSALNFVTVYKPAFITTKRSICGTEKTFPEKTSILFFFVFGLETWSFVFLSAIGSRLFKRVPKNNPRKIFFWTRREEKLAFEWHFFGSLGRTVRWGVSKYSISHHPMNNLQEKNSENFFTLYICFYAWRTKYCSLGAKPKQVVKLSPED